MAEQPSLAKDGPRLFEQHEQAHDQRIRQQQVIFIFTHVKDGAANMKLSGPDCELAYAIAVCRAEIQTLRNLARLKQTSIITHFLDQLAGGGLGCQLKTKCPIDYHCDPKFAVWRKRAFDR